MRAATSANLLEPSLSALRPAAADIERWTDRYFLKTKQTIGRFGDKTVCYAIFMRRPVIFTPRLMVRWLEQVVAARQHRRPHRSQLQRGRLGRRRRAADLHHRLVLSSGRSRNPVPAEAGRRLRRRLQRVHHVHRPARVAFIAMDARHCAGIEMAEMMAYAAAVGRKRRSGRRAPRVHRLLPTTRPRTTSAGARGSARCRTR